jgi:hypothetical protein
MSEINPDAPSDSLGITVEQEATASHGSNPGAEHSVALLIARKNNLSWRHEITLKF